MTDKDYLQQFNRIVDVAIAFNKCLHEQAIINTFTKRKYPGENYSSLNNEQKKSAQTASSDLYLGTMFITQSNSSGYGNLFK